MSQYTICKKISNYTHSIKLDLNESDFKHHPDIYKSIYECIIKPKSLTHYSNIYDENTLTLLQYICEYNNITAEQVLLSSGSDNALEYLNNKYVDNETHVFIFSPSYNYFECIVKNKTQNIYHIPLDFNEKEPIKIDDSLEFYEEIMFNSIVYIVNPNNPLGKMISVDSIESVLNKYPNTLFIIDEAYIEFNIEYSCISLINNYENIIITRTFSKAYGLAGLRLGYIISNKNIINDIKNIYNEKNVTEIAKTAGIAVFKNLFYYEYLIDEISNIREEFQHFLLDLSIYYIESNTNFVSFYVGKNLNKFLKILESNDIYIRNRDNQIDLSGFVRITIGTREHMFKVCDIIKNNIDLFESNKRIIKYKPKYDIWKLKLLLKKVIKILNENNIIYWLSNCSILGIYKCNGILPYVNHMNISILGNKNNILRLFENENINIFNDKIKNNFNDEIHINLLFWQYDKISFPLQLIKFYNVIDVYIPSENKESYNCESCKNCEIVEMNEKMYYG